MTVPNNSTGCYILDTAGVTSAHQGVEICENCPRNELGEECILIIKDRIKDTDLDIPIPPPPVMEERTVKCLNCKAMEDLTFTNKVLDTTQKWYQEGGRIYHRGKICGEARIVGGI